MSVSTVGRSVGHIAQIQFFFSFCLSRIFVVVVDRPAYFSPCRNQNGPKEIAAVLINFERHPEWLFKEVKIR